MSDATPKKVNILSICESNTAAALKRIEDSEAALKSAKEQVLAIVNQQQDTIDSSAAELAKIIKLIQDNEKEGIDTQKLEKKAADIKTRIAQIQDDYSKSDTLSAAKIAEKVAMDEIVRAKEAHEICKTQASLAQELKKSHELDPSCGAIEALEFETLDEAIDEYICNIPLIVSISEEMMVKWVLLFQDTCNAPKCLELKTSSGEQYHYSIIPKELGWLKKIPGSEYCSMPSVSDLVIGQVEGVNFLQGARGSINGPLKVKTPSVYSPDGEAGSKRSGLCYVKSKNKFYAFCNMSFPVVEMIPGKVRKKDSYGYEVETDGMIPKRVTADLSRLFEGFGGPMEEKLSEQTKEFSQLDKATTPLVRRVVKAVKATSVLNSPFELRGERMDEAAISREIGTYWDAFVNAPWEAALVKSVAMVKHLCQRKLETPHFWSNKVKGHYGFRVRTRDHDWIIGEIYCPPASFSPKEKVPNNAVMYYRDNWQQCDTFIKSGPCFINVIGRKE